MTSDDPYPLITKFPTFEEAEDPQQVMLQADSFGMSRETERPRFDERCISGNNLEKLQRKFNWLFMSENWKMQVQVALSKAVIQYAIDEQQIEIVIKGLGNCSI